MTLFYGAISVVSTIVFYGLLTLAHYFITIDYERRNAMADNMVIWEAVKQPPKSALKTIGAGRLKGMTDVKPAWRYQVMTEQFGAVGFGWWYETLREWTEAGNDGQVMAFVRINLYVRVNDVVSEPIGGIGGSMLVTKEKAGLHTSDEGYKMATTDALSTAMMRLGVAADVYLGNWTGSKYVNSEPPVASKPAPPKPVDWVGTAHKRFVECNRDMDKIFDVVDAIGGAKDKFPDESTYLDALAQYSEVMATGFSGDEIDRVGAKVAQYQAKCNSTVRQAQEVF